MDKVLFSSGSVEWETPQELFDALNVEFNFTLDPCATEKNTKCELFYDVELDGLQLPWFGNVFVNPPYGKAVGKWVEKSAKEIQEGNADLIVLLLPARTDTKWFHDFIYKKAEIIFLRGRLKFKNRTLPSWKQEGGFTISSAPFPSMIVVMRRGGIAV